MFVGAGVLPSTVGIVEKKTTFKEIKSPGYIQNLIDNASDGDTIYIPSGIYYENIIIDTSISLVGEDKDTTIIDGSDSGDVVYISADWVNISGFTIQNSGGGWVAGIAIGSNYNNITGNSISNNDNGIYLDESSSNTITGNNISSNHEYAIYFDDSYGNNITGNTISNNEYCIGLYADCENNTVTGNTISNNYVGISVGPGDYNNYNTISGNNISYNDFGIHLGDYSNNNVIYHNNFIINYISNAIDKGNNIWDDGEYGNYWSDYQKKYPDAKKKTFKGIWDTPYEIEGGDNKDNFPLINQYPKSVIKSKSRAKAFNYNFPLLNWLFERFPNAFPVLRYLVKLYTPSLPLFSFN